jgi:hypothetical protein
LLVIECRSQNVLAFLHRYEVRNVEEIDRLIAGELDRASRETAQRQDDTKAGASVMDHAVKITNNGQARVFL